MMQCLSARVFALAADDIDNAKLVLFPYIRKQWLRFVGRSVESVAVRHFGAVMGQREGLQGQSYAIPTMEGIDEMRAAIHRFATFAQAHPNLRFLVTRVGCGAAGYGEVGVAQLFRECVALENVALPAGFWRALGLKMYL